MTDNDLRYDMRDYFTAVGAVPPGVGELDRAVLATARIRPRPAWQVQLAAATTVFRAPAIGGLQFATWLALLLLAIALLAMGLAVAGRQSAATPFEGRWVAVDTDGSDMLMVVSGGTEPSVHFEDFGASACLGAGDRNVHWISDGVGSIHDDRLFVDYPNGGGCTAWHIPAYTNELVLEPGGEVINDSSGTVWRHPDPGPSQ